MLAHSFNRFYVVTKFILPSIGDLKFSKLSYDNTCAYLDNKNIHDTDTRKYFLDLITFCKKIAPFVIYHKILIESYNITAHNTLKNEKRSNFASSTKETKTRNYHHISVQLHRISL